MPRHPGRSGAAWRKVRAQVLKHATHCYICGEEIDFTARPRSPRAPSVDHVVPISRTLDMDPKAQRRIALDPANLRPAHYGCNAGRGNRRRRRNEPPRTSRNW